MWINAFTSFGKPAFPSLFQEGGTFPYYNQHLFSGLYESTHPQPHIPDNWPFNGSPQCNTVCTLTDYNQCPSLQWYNSYLFSAERITPLMCRGYLLLLITVVCFYPLPALLKSCHCVLLKSAKRLQHRRRAQRLFSHRKKKATNHLSQNRLTPAGIKFKRHVCKESHQWNKSTICTMTLKTCELQLILHSTFHEWNQCHICLSLLGLFHLHYK